MQPSTLTEFKIALLRKGLTQTSLARQLNVSVRYVRYMIAGKVPAHRTWQRLRTEFDFPSTAIPKHNSRRTSARTAIKDSGHVSKAIHA